MRFIFPRHDVDHLQALNQELEQAGSQLAEANAIKDEFLAQVSHDLRTPLNSILSFTKLVLDGLCTTPEEEKEVLRDVFSSGQLLLRLVNDLLDISCIEAGKLAAESGGTVDPRAMLDSTLPLDGGAGRIPEPPSGRRNPGSETFPWVRGDEIRFRQVLLNLLSNAVKFTAKRTRHRPRHAKYVDMGICVSRSKTLAWAIPTEKRNAMFEKFVRHDAQSLAGTSTALDWAWRLPNDWWK